jgi:hypothetical protein
MRRAPRLLVVAAAIAAAAPSFASAEPAPPLLGSSATEVSPGHWRVRTADGYDLFTHGPDPKPDHGGGMGPGDPERAPACGTDYYQHVLYGRLSGAVDRLFLVKADIQAAVRRMNAVLDEESQLSGNRHADYKVKCDGTGAVQVDSFASPSMDYQTIVTYARASGYLLPNVDYSIFFDAQPANYCGLGSFIFDEDANNNSNNDGGGYAVSYNQCWNGETPMHENGHNQGAVQYNAPYSTGNGGHCYDENDVMCYSPDGGDKHQEGTINRCGDRIHYDCGNDSYFDSAPEQGEYLESHWNIGSSQNRFVVIGDPLNGAPTAAFTPDCTDLSCTFTDASTDDGAIVARAWDFGDGGNSTATNPTHTFAEPGTYTVSLTVTDDGGLTAEAAAPVTVPPGVDPDPDTQTLTPGEAYDDIAPPVDDWNYYKILVPAGRAQLQVVLDGPACVLALCNPDLDLHVRAGQRPTETAYQCRPFQVSNDETCTIASPAAGYWYVGVHNFSLAYVSFPIAHYTVTASY